MRTIIITSILAALLAPGQLLACDIDSDCGAGGTCIKREKRARGVCYGGHPSRSDNEDSRSPNYDDSPRFDNPAMQVPGHGDMSQFDGHYAPVPGAGMFNPLVNPGERPAGACIVTQECPAGMDCVITGPGGGRCMAL